MKTLIVCLLCSTLITSTQAAYRDFRVTQLAPMQLSVEELILNAQIDESMVLSFTCNQDQRYIVWASESLEPATWFPIKENVVPGQNTTIENIGGEDIATVVLPKPFMSHWTSGCGFVRVSEAKPEPVIVPTDLVPIQGFVNNGTYITVTFKSEAFREYIIEGVDSPVATNWVPVDIYGHENSIDHIKIPSQGTVTSVDISNPMLPHILVDGGWIRIRHLPTSASTFAQVSVLRGPVVAATTPTEKVWYLVCTRDGTHDPNPPKKSLGFVFGEGWLKLNLFAVGPRLGTASKYQVLQGVVFSQAMDYGVPINPYDNDLRSITVPIQLNPEVGATTIKTMVALSRYVGGEEPPTVIYLPPSNPNQGFNGRLQCYLEIRESSVVSAATWNNSIPIKDGVDLKAGGFGYTISVGGEYTQTTKKVWQFNAMNVEMYDEFTRMLLNQ